MKNQSWNVTVLTESGYIKTVQVDNCITREDAEAQALGMTGAKRVFNSNPVAIFQQQYESYEVETDHSVVNNNYYYEDDDSYDYKSLDKLEEEMYDIMCELAIEEGRELPTYEEFYEYLNSGNSKPNPVKRVWNKLTGWMNK